MSVTHDHQSDWSNWKQEGRCVYCTCGERLYQGKKPTTPGQAEQTLAFIEYINPREEVDMPTRRRTPEETELTAVEELPEGTEEDTFIEDQDVVYRTGEDAPMDAPTFKCNVGWISKRDVKGNGSDYENNTAQVNLSMEWKGMVNPEELRGQLADLFLQAKATVFDELGADYATDEEGIIRETFKDSRTVSRKTAAPVRTAPASRAPAGRATTTPRGQQARGGQRGASGPASRGRAAAPPTPSQVDLWHDLKASPQNWQDVSQTKENPKGPDFLSLVYQNDRGFPAALWLNDRNIPFDESEIPGPEEFAE